MTTQEHHRPSPFDDDVDLHHLGDRLGRQLAAMRAWNLQVDLDHRAGLVAKVTRSGTRASRARQSSRRRTQAAVVARSNRPIDETMDLFFGGKPLALVVHPDLDTRRQLRGRLMEIGIEVLATCPDGAEGLGIAIVEQPDLVVLDDRIASSTGLELLADLLQWSTAIVAAQVDDELVMAAMLDGGASAVFSREVSAAVMAEAVDALVRGRAMSPLQVR